MVALARKGEQEMKKNILIGALATVFAVGLVGCSPQARQQYDAAGDSIEKGVEKTGDAVATDAQKTGDAIEQGAQNAGEAIENTADKAGQAAQNAGEAIENSAEKAGQAAQEAGAKVGAEADEAQTTLAVKNAILAADDINAGNLNVDTEGKTVHLRGSVNNQSAKSRAEQIAKGIVGKEYTVKNELKVGG